MKVSIHVLLLKVKKKKSPIVLSFWSTLAFSRIYPLFSGLPGTEHRKEKSLCTVCIRPLCQEGSPKFCQSTGKTLNEQWNIVYYCEVSKQDKIRRLY